MNIILWIVIFIVYLSVGIGVGYLIRGSSELMGKAVPAMAWGYEEKNNVWNRIRVDEQGNVMCHKE